MAFTVNYDRFLFYALEQANIGFIDPGMLPCLLHAADCWNMLHHRKDKRKVIVALFSMLTILKLNFSCSTQDKL